MKLQGREIYLDTLERADCRQLWQDYEYDAENPCEELKLGQSVEKAEDWFEDIQKRQGNTHVRLGIFLNDGTLIGDVALQDIDRFHRCCSVGMGIQKLKYRSCGYGKQALRLMLRYGFHCLGMERITANTLSPNEGARRSLEKCGFVLEGRERQAVYLAGKKVDRLNYAILRDEFVNEA